MSFILCLSLVFKILSAKSLQSCPTLWDPIDGSPPGSPVPGILQARTLKWVAISCSNAWKWKVQGKSLSRAWPSATPWTAAFQAPLSMGFSRQEYWSGVPLPSLKILTRLILFFYQNLEAIPIWRAYIVFSSIIIVSQIKSCSFHYCGVLQKITSWKKHRLEKKCQDVTVLTMII